MYTHIKMTHMNMMYYIHTHKTMTHINMMYYIHTHNTSHAICVNMASVVDQIISLFCKRALQKRRYSAKETCNFVDATDRSHAICVTGDVKSCVMGMVCE